MTRIQQISEKFFWVIVVAAIVFFMRGWTLGLSPDAALYAGLSYKVMSTGEQWLLSGVDHKFQIYFEHPPFFFQWGARVLRTLGTSDGSARAIGGIPGYLGLVFFVMWLWRRINWAIAALTLLMALVLGPYMVQASSTMHEAPLSFAVIMIAVACYELHWRSSLGRLRIIWWIPLFSGLALATASKGVPGLVAFVGVVLSLFFALLFSERAPFKVLLSVFSLGTCFLAALAPFAYWFYKLSSSREDVERFVRHIAEQFLKTITSAPNESLNVLSGDRYYYLKVISNYAWPWWWAWMLGLLLLFISPFLKKRWPECYSRPLRAWALNSMAFALGYLVPFSFFFVQLPHFIHPIYLPLLPIGAFFLLWTLQKLPIANYMESIRVRWVIAALILGYSQFVPLPESQAGVRGQEFIDVASSINKLPKLCKVAVPKGQVDAYRMEAYAMWYFRAREWEFLARPLPSHIAVPDRRIYWEPTTPPKLWAQSGCQP